MNFTAPFRSPPLARRRRENYLTYSLLLLFVILGFYFRFHGIKDNHSFWADESHLAAAAKDMSFGKNNFSEKYGYLKYEILQIIVTSQSFKIFGASEFSARLPTVIIGTIGIIFAFFLAKSISGSGAGILASFLMAFSQLNLSNSTQNKPYTAIQTLLLIVLYLIGKIKKSQKKILVHLIIITCVIAAYFFHVLGSLIVIPYLTYLITENKSGIYHRFTKRPFLSVLIVVFLILIIRASLLGNLIVSFFKPSLTNGRFIFVFNNTTYLRELLWKNYGFIFLPSIIGMLAVFRKNKSQVLGTVIFSFFMFFLWSFRSYSHNIRYIVSFFGIMFVYFGVFWSEVGKKLFNGQSVLLCLFIAIVFYLGGNKLVRRPLTYYGPNEDLYGDVQIADYKKVYSLIKQRFSYLDNYVIFDDINSTELWYLGKSADVLFTKEKNQKPDYDKYNKVYIYKNKDQFLEQKQKYKKGILIIEDWESLLPEDIKQYAKKNMKFEFRVDGLPQAGNDKWPIEVYSWGNLQ